MPSPAAKGPDHSSDATGRAPNPALSFPQTANRERHPSFGTLEAEEVQHLDAIRVAPRDIAARHAYAAWHEQHGRHLLAQCIRSHANYYYSDDRQDLDRLAANWIVGMYTDGRSEEEVSTHILSKMKIGYPVIEGRGGVPGQFLIRDSEDWKPKLTIGQFERLRRILPVTAIDYVQHDDDPEMKALTALSSVADVGKDSIDHVGIYVNHYDSSGGVAISCISGISDLLSCKIVGMYIRSHQIGSIVDNHPTLQHFFVGGPFHRNDDFADAVEYLRPLRLRSLTLGMEVTPAILEAVASLDTIECLGIIDEVEPSSLSVLARMPRLCGLYIQSDGVREMMPYLAQVPELRAVDFDHTQIGDDEVDALALPPKLAHVGAVKSKFSQQGLQRLSKLTDGRVTIYT